MAGDRRVVDVLRRIRRGICSVNDGVRRDVYVCHLVVPWDGSSRSLLFLRLF